jgi:YbbR domain-containing protein
MRDLFFKDFGWKLFSLLLAVFIWITVHKLIERPGAVSVSSTSDLVTYSNLPVFFISTAADTSAYRVQPNLVTVTVSGPSTVMSVLDANQIRATVDLSEAEPGHDSNERVSVSVPPGVAVFNIAPATVKVTAPAKH